MWAVSLCLTLPGCNYGIQLIGEGGNSCTLTESICTKCTHVNHGRHKTVRTELLLEVFTKWESLQCLIGTWNMLKALNWEWLRVSSSNYLFLVVAHAFLLTHLPKHAENYICNISDSIFWMILIYLCGQDVFISIQWSESSLNHVKISLYIF